MGGRRARGGLRSDQAHLPELSRWLSLSLSYLFLSFPAQRKGERERKALCS